MALLLSKGDFFTLFLSGGTEKLPRTREGNGGWGMESSWRWKKRVEVLSRGDSFGVGGGEVTRK